MVLRQFTPARLRDLVEGAAAVAGQTDLQAILATTVEIAMDLTGAPHALFRRSGFADHSEVVV